MYNQCIIYIFKTSLKLSRSDAIFEFYSLNSNILLNVTFECRVMQLLRPDITNLNNNITSLFTFYTGFVIEKRAGERKGSVCEERGLKLMQYMYADSTYNICATSIEGEKCSFNL